MLKLFTCICLILLSTAMICSAAQAEVSDNDITRVEEALNRITTFKAPFTQLAEDGKRSSGTFYLSRPGKIRWEYTEPVPILIVGQKSLIAYYDSQLDEVSYMRLEEALAGFLTHEKIDLRKELKIVSMDREKGTLRIKVLPTNAQAQGELTLTFNDQDMLLTGLQVVDSVGNHTQIAFSDIQQGLPLDSALFVYPHEKKQGRKKH